MTYELWDDVSGNLVDWFDSEEHALAVIRIYLAENGPDHVVGLRLRELDEHGQTLRVTHGIDLVLAARRGAAT